MDIAPKTLYSRQEAATSFSISVRTLDYLVAQGQIRVVRKGRRVMIHRTEIERWAKIDNPKPIRQSGPRPAAESSAQLNLS